MTADVELIVGRKGRDHKRVVAAVWGNREHRDVFETDVAFHRRKWRDAVCEKLGLGEDAHEWLEGELLTKADAADDSLPRGKPVVKPLTEFKHQSTEWLWDSYIPAAAISGIDGDPGLGKSQLTCWLAGAVSRNSPMPDGSRNPLGRPRGVLLLSAEDDPSRTIRPRVEAVGGDLTRIHMMPGIECGDGDERPLALPDDAPALEAAIEDHDAALVIIDPLVCYMASGLSMNNDADVRRALKPLASIAESTGAAIVYLRHLNKRDGGPSIYRGGGSIGIIGAARAAYVVAKCEDDPDTRVFAPVKMNLAKMPRSLTFHIEPSGSTSRVEWGEGSDLTADDLLGGNDKKAGGKFEVAKRIIEDALAGGPRGSNEVESLCDDEGVSKSTYWRARKALGVEAEKAEFAGQWLLSLPRNDAPEPFQEFL